MWVSLPLGNFPGVRIRPKVPRFFSRSPFRLKLSGDTLQGFVISFLYNPIIFPVFVDFRFQRNFRAQRSMDFVRRAEDLCDAVLAPGGSPAANPTIGTDGRLPSATDYRLRPKRIHRIGFFLERLPTFF